jgi:hypothetical protein
MRLFAVGLGSNRADNVGVDARLAPLLETLRLTGRSRSLSLAHHSGAPAYAPIEWLRVTWLLGSCGGPRFLAPEELANLVLIPWWRLRVLGVAFVPFSMLRV